MHRSFSLAIAFLLFPWITVGANAAQTQVDLLVESRNSADEVVELRHRDALRSGDGLRFRLTTRKKAYVYLFALGTSGRWSVIQPYSGNPADALQAPDEPRALPGDGSFLPLDDRTGTETLFSVGFDEPISDLPDFLEDLGKFTASEAAQEPDGLRSELAERFPQMTFVELQHLPGFVRVGRAERGPPSRAARTRRANAPIPTVESGVFQGQAIDEEPGVLSAEGTVIRRLLGGAAPAPIPHANPALPSPTRGTPSRPRSEVSPDLRLQPAPAPAPPKEEAGIFGRLGGTIGALFSSDSDSNEVPAGPAPPSATSSDPITAPSNAATGGPTPATTISSSPSTRARSSQSRPVAVPPTEVRRPSVTAAPIVSAERAERVAPRTVATPPTVLPAPRAPSSNAASGLTSPSPTPGPTPGPTPSPAPNPAPNPTPNPTGESAARESSAPGSARPAESGVETRRIERREPRVAALAPPPAALPSAPESRPSPTGRRLTRIDAAADTIGGALVLIVTPDGAGSGVVIGKERLILTSWHLVDGQESVTILTRAPGGVPRLSEPRLARVVRFNVFSDLALLKPIQSPGDLPFTVLADQATAASEGESVHVLSHDNRQTWRHDFAMVVQDKSEHSWFSGNNVIHRAPALRLQMSTPPRVDGGPVLNGDGKLVGLKVHTGSGTVTAVSLVAIRAFLAADGQGG